MEEDVELKTEPYERAPVINLLSYDLAKKDNCFSLLDRIEGDKIAPVLRKF